MTIHIAARLKPFSHQLGTICLIPLTSIQVQVFPTLLRFSDLVTSSFWEEKLEWKGPVEGFTVQLDLDKSRVVVYGKTADGFRRLWIEAVAKGIEMTWEKENKRKIIDCPVIKKPASIERLSLGKHTQLDWSVVLRKLEMEEAVPALFLLGQQVPTAHAVSPILNLLEFSDKERVVDQLKSFFRVGFHGLLTPRLQDSDFQGIVDDSAIQGSPLALLNQGYQAVRSLFFREEENGFSFLPFLPPAFHAGRITHLHSSKGDLISIEWSKKLLKRVTIKPAVSREIFLLLQKNLHSYRVNHKNKQEVKTSLELKAGHTLFLDRFEK